MNSAAMTAYETDTEAYEQHLTTSAEAEMLHRQSQELDVHEKAAAEIQQYKGAIHYIEKRFESIIKHTDNQFVNPDEIEMLSVLYFETLDLVEKYSKSNPEKKAEIQTYSAALIKNLLLVITTKETSVLKLEILQQIERLHSEVEAINTNPDHPCFTLIRALLQVRPDLNQSLSGLFVEYEETADREQKMELNESLITVDITDEVFLNVPQIQTFKDHVAANIKLLLQDPNTTSAFQLMYLLDPQKELYQSMLEENKESVDLDRYAEVLMKELVTKFVSLQLEAQIVQDGVVVKDNAQLEAIINLNAVREETDTNGTFSPQSFDQITLRAVNGNIVPDQDLVIDDYTIHIAAPGY